MIQLISIQLCAGNWLSEESNKWKKVLVFSFNIWYRPNLIIVLNFTEAYFAVFKIKLWNRSYKRQISSSKIFQF